MTRYLSQSPGQPAANGSYGHVALGVFNGFLQLGNGFQQLFGFGHGQGYPKERVIPEQRNKKILDEVKKVTHRKLIEILHDIDQDFLKETISGEHFAEYFYPYCKDEQVANYLKNL